MMFLAVVFLAIGHLVIFPVLFIVFKTGIETDTGIISQLTKRAKKMSVTAGDFKDLTGSYIMIFNQLTGQILDKFPEKRGIIISKIISVERDFVLVIPIVLNEPASLDKIAVLLFRRAPEWLLPWSYS